MASRLLSILTILGSGASRAANRPNSWAVVSMWQRFFQMKDEEERENIDTVLAALEETTKPAPITSDYVKEQMDHFKRSTSYNNSTTTIRSPTLLETQFGTTSNSNNNSNNNTNTTTNNTPFQQVVQQYEDQVLRRPNLSVGPDSIYLAQ